jgi:PIN domain nuclease of toxin-antitoxin system
MPRSAGSAREAVSAASAWEISIKKALGKLAAPDDLEQQVLAGGFSPLPVSIAHGVAAGQLPRHHEHPFDRMLIAQAFAEGLTIVTRDKRFCDYGVPLLPA